MSKIIKAHSLTGRITDGLMLASFKAVKRNRGAAGIDKVSIKMFEANLADNLRAWMRDLKSGSFQPHPLRRHLIPKNETEFRPPRYSSGSRSGRSRGGPPPLESHL